MKVSLKKVSSLTSMYLAIQLGGHVYGAITTLPTPKKLFGVDRPNLPIESSPALSANLQTLYVGAGDGSSGRVYAVTNLYASTPPQLQWEFMPDGAIGSASPSVGTDGTVYIGSQNGTVYAISSDGSLKWRFFTGTTIGGSPALSSTSTIFTGNLDGKVFSISSSGNMNWVIDAPGPVSGGIVIGRDGTLYVPIFLNGGGNIIALNPTTGAVKWQGDPLVLDRAVSSSPALGNDGKIYIGTSNSGSGDGIRVINPVTGALLSSATFPSGYLDSSPAIAPAYSTYPHAVFAGVDFENEIFRMNVSGGSSAEIALVGPNGVAEHSVEASPAVDSAGNVWIGDGHLSGNGHVFRVFRDETTIGRYPDDVTVFLPPVESSPVIGSNTNGTVSRVFFGCADGNLYAFDCASLASSSWPMYRGNPQHTGRQSGPSVSIAAGSAAAEPSTAGSFTITKSVTGTITINLNAVADANPDPDAPAYATPGADFTITSSQGTVGGTNSNPTLTFSGTSCVVNVAPLDDSLVEGTEIVQLHVALGDGYSVGGTGKAEIELADNDTALPTVRVSATGTSATEGGTTTITFAKRARAHCRCRWICREALPSILITRFPPTLNLSHTS